MLTSDPDEVDVGKAKHPIHDNDEGHGPLAAHVPLRYARASIQNTKPFGTIGNQLDDLGYQDDEFQNNAYYEHP